MTAPITIHIKSDGNILTLKNTIKTKDGLRYQYLYSKSIEKKGMVLEMDEVQLQKLISNNQ